MSGQTDAGALLAEIEQEIRMTSAELAINPDGSRQRGRLLEWGEELSRRRLALHTATPRLRELEAEMSKIRHATQRQAKRTNQRVGAAWRTAAWCGVPGTVALVIGSTGPFATIVIAGVVLLLAGASACWRAVHLSSASVGDPAAGLAAEYDAIISAVISGEKNPPSSTSGSPFDGIDGF